MTGPGSTRRTPLTALPRRDQALVLVLQEAQRLDGRQGWRGMEIDPTAFVSGLRLDALTDGWDFWYDPPRLAPLLFFWKCRSCVLYHGLHQAEHCHMYPRLARTCYIAKQRNDLTVLTFLPGPPQR